MLTPLPIFYLNPRDDAGGPNRIAECIKIWLCLTDPQTLEKYIPSWFKKRMKSLLEIISMMEVRPLRGYGEICFYLLHRWETVMIWLYRCGCWSIVFDISTYIYHGPLNILLLNNNTVCLFVIKYLQTSIIKKKKRKKLTRNAKEIFHPLSLSIFRTWLKVQTEGRFRGRNMVCFH